MIVWSLIGGACLCWLFDTERGVSILQKIGRTIFFWKRK